MPALSVSDWSLARSQMLTVLLTDVYGNEAYSGGDAFDIYPQTTFSPAGSQMSVGETTEAALGPAMYATAFNARAGTAPFQASLPPAPRAHHRPKNK
eukprot:6210336-Pyramimonas_sp.AAC.2